MNMLRRISVSCAVWVMLMISVAAKPPALTNFKCGYNNICFVNAVLQNVFNIVELNNDLLMVPESNQNELTKAYLAMYREAMSNPPDPFLPKKFLDAAQKYVNKVIGTGMASGQVFYSRLLYDAPQSLLAIGSSLYDKWSGIVCAEYSGGTREKVSFLHEIFPDIVGSYMKNLATLQNVNLKTLLNFSDPRHKNEVRRPIVLKNSHYVIFDTELFRQNFSMNAQIQALGNTDLSIQIPKRMPLAVESALGTIHDQEFELIGMLIHRGMHFVAYIADQYDSAPQKPWYFCNDLASLKVNLEPKMFDSSDNVAQGLEFEPDKHAMLLFYKRVGFNPFPLVHLYNLDRDLRAIV